VETYYERRAPEYDDWYRGEGRFEDRERPGWDEELSALREALAAIRPSRTLDVACGTGFLTRDLPGDVTGLDRSEAMVRIARSRVHGPFVRADALALPFRSGSFGRVFAGHFYGHLPGTSRDVFLREASRVASEIVILDSARREDVDAEEVQERVLSDESTHLVYKRYFEPEELLAEIGGGRRLFAGRWFVLVARS
jgi:ubiquinone/menaquinone biosynthesis C-methylase UbiE